MTDQPQEIRTIPIGDISVLDVCRMRLIVRQDKIEEYAERMRDGSTPPPVEVTELPDGRLVLTNGEHRLRAHEQNQTPTISAIVRPGNMDDAVIRAASADNDAPLSRTTDDKRQAVQKLLHIPEVAESWSESRIARTVQVSRPFVQKIAETVYPGWSERDRNIVVERSGETFTMINSHARTRRASIKETLGEEQDEAPQEDMLDLPDNGAPAPTPSSRPDMYRGSGSRSNNRSSSNGEYRETRNERPSRGFEPLDTIPEQFSNGPVEQPISQPVSPPEAAGVTPDMIFLSWGLPNGREDTVTLGDPQARLRIPPDVWEVLLSALGIEIIEEAE